MTAPIPLTMPRVTPGICGVCRSRDIGSGITATGWRAKAIWTCADITCIDAARDTIDMQQRVFDDHEAKAADAGVAEAAEYARHIGTSDLAKMTARQISEFGLTLVAGYRAALAAEIKGGKSA